MLIVGSGILTLWREKARGTKLAAEGQVALTGAPEEAPSSKTAPEPTGCVVPAK